MNITLNSDASKEKKEKLYIMNVDLELIGDLTDEQKNVLIKAAEQSCPIGQMLAGEVKVKINENIV